MNNNHRLHQGCRAASAKRRTGSRCATATALSLASLGIGLALPFAEARGAEEQTLETMVVAAERPALPANLPATNEGVTARQIEESNNTVTTAETIQYLPSVHVRQRYIGDRNAIIAMRANSSIASAQTVLYADNLLLSNFLNNSFSTPPRWGMVSPEEIERVDVIYGPFSALFPGNSMGGVVVLTTRMPEKLEAHAKLDLFGQRFKLYGADQDFTGVHGSAAIADKVGPWSFWLDLDHLDNHGHPQTFGAATRPTQPAAATPFTAVRGEFRDIDTSGNPRIIGSAIGADHSLQDNGKLKLAFDLSPTWRASYILGIWQNRSDTGVDSYLRDAAGNAVFNTTASGATKFVKFAGDNTFYTLTGVSPGHSESEHWMHGLSLKSDTKGSWDWEAVVSLYDQKTEVSRSAANTGSLTDSGSGPVRPAGTRTVGDGTGWRTLDLRGEWRPGGDLKSAHQVSFGYHDDRYELLSDTFNVADWLSGDGGSLTTNSRGKTEIQAAYLQDAWHFAPDWQLVVGGRQERWKAFEGSNFNATPPNPSTPRTVRYADRSVSAFSPKAALSFQASPLWNLRAAYGEATRFPTVAEIFQLINFGSGVQRTNDPNLKPERTRSAEFAAERVFENGLARVSLFYEDKRDGLVSQTDTTVSPNVASIQNVDKIRTRGLEAVLQAADVWVRGLDLSGSVTYAESTILQDARNTGLEGTDQPRIPHWRATLVGVYHASDKLSLSLAARYSGPQHNALFNTATRQYNDVNPGVYGAVSPYTVVDAKLLYRFAKQWSGSLGVNNLGNYTYFVNPNPYPQRTFFAGLKFDYL